MRLVRQVRQSAVARLVADHAHSLPTWESGTTRFGEEPRRSFWPSWILFVVAPLGATAAIRHWAKSAEPDAVTGGLLAGVGVLAGLLVQVLAWVSGRIGSVADAADEAPLTDRRRRLLTRLSMARANIAYACLVSIAFTILLGVQASVNKPSPVFTIIDLIALLHLGPTLVLVLLRVNSIGETDDRMARTASAARQSSRTDHGE